MANTTNQSFDYNIHTKRCGHAGNYNENDYVYEAVASGMKTIGFACHAPSSIYEYQNVKQAMNISEIGDYIISIKTLKSQHTDINILVGFEASYDKKNSDLLVSLRDNVDYMVLSMANLENVEINGKYPLLYSKMICEAMDSGLFDLCNDPDIFLVKRKDIEDKVRSGKLLNEELVLFDNNANVAINEICSKAKSNGIPLEIDVSEFIKRNKNNKDIFFDKALSSSVIFSSNAHSPNEISTFNRDIREVVSDFNIREDIIIKEYNPVTNRSEELNRLYSIFKSNVLTYKYYETKNILNNVLENIEEENYLPQVENRLMGYRDSLYREYESRRNNNSSNSNTYLDGLKNTYEAKDKLVSEIIATERSMISKYRFGTRENFVNIMSKLVEYTSTRNENVKNAFSKDINDFIKESESLGSSVERNAKLSKVNPYYRGSEEDNNYNGFTTAAFITMILSFIIGFGIGIAYMIIKLGM